MIYVMCIQNTWHRMHIKKNNVQKITGGEKKNQISLTLWERHFKWEENGTAYWKYAKRASQLRIPYWLLAKMEAEVNTCCLLVQPQKELQLDLKTKNTQNHQKIEQYGSPTTKELEKPHSSRQAGEAETWGQAVVEWAVTHSSVVDKNPWEWVIPAPGQNAEPRIPSTRKINLYNFWLGQWEKLPDFQETLLKGPTRT